MNTRLPDLPQKGGGSTPHADDSKSHIKECDKRSKLAMKRYSDSHRNTAVKQINIGDKVLILRQGHCDKQTTPYNPQPYKVTAKTGSMITAQRGMHKVTRNISQFKVLPAAERRPISESDEDDDGDRIPTDAAEVPQTIAQDPPLPPQANLLPPVPRYGEVYQETSTVVSDYAQVVSTKDIHSG